MRIHVLLGMLLFAVAFGVLGQSENPPASTPPMPQALTNADVISLVQAGLDEGIIISKIQHSATAFNTATAGLVELKNANVPSSVVKAMIERSDASYAAPAPHAETKNPVATPSPQPKALEQVEKVRIRADSEVLRVVIDQRLRAEGGPAVSTSETDYDATLSFATDCGAQTISMWSGANFCTCEGSLTAESFGYQLYSSLDRERSANAAKSSKLMAERMIEKFIAAWKKARRK